MKAVISRVTSASVVIQKKIVGKINDGLLIFLGIERNDEIMDVNKLVKKIITLRIFNDEKGMNKSIMGYCGGENIVDFQKKAEFIQSTQAGVRESHPHEVKITKEAPNYQISDTK